VALCDLNTERAQKVAQDTGVENAQIFSDHRAMLDSAEIDAVSVCLPNSFHAPVSIDCLKADKHVLCEKPLAMNAKEGQKIADAAAKNNKKCYGGAGQSLSGADSKYLKDRIAAGDLGDIYYAHTGWLRKRGIPGYGGWFHHQGDERRRAPHRHRCAHARHRVVAVRLPAPRSCDGRDLRRVRPKGRGLGKLGAEKKPEGTFDVEDLAAAYRFENGLTINLEVSWALNNRKERQWCQIFGNEGALRLGQRHRHLSRGWRHHHHNDARSAQDRSVAGRRCTFLDSILNDTTPDPTSRRACR
jgi:predicted dehydrogenase